MRRALLVPAVAALAAGCNPPGAGSPGTRPAPASPLQYSLGDLVGDWRWLLRTSEDGTTRIEDETWYLRRSPAAPTKLVGQYHRTLEVRAEDRVPFRCNQRPWYRQRAVFDVEVELLPTGFAVRETGYRTEPSPCDRGFRRMGRYAARLEPGRLVLTWDGGSQTLHAIGPAAAAPAAAAPDELPEEPWPATPKLTGPWRWDAVSYDDDGNVRTEHEWWEITHRDESRLDVTYRRRVIVRSPDGGVIACANAPAWSFDDAYVLDGQREEEHWHLHELATEPGDHPCLRATPERSLDEATAEQLGDFLVLEWRGKRRQVLYRPDR